jgi:hypothetical protein
MVLPEVFHQLLRRSNGENWTIGSASMGKRVLCCISVPIIAGLRSHATRSSPSLEQVHFRRSDQELTIERHYCVELRQLGKDFPAVKSWPIAVVSAAVPGQERKRGLVVAVQSGQALLFPAAAGSPRVVGRSGPVTLAPGDALLLFE